MTNAPRSFLGELKRRRVIRTAAIYLAAGWAMIQVADVVFPALLLPAWTVRLVILLVLFAFPVALVISWAFEWTETGMHREESAPAAPTRRGRRRIVLGSAAVLVVGVSVALTFWARAPRRFQLAPASGSAFPAIAVLPFDVKVDGQELWREGMVDLLSTNLDGVAGLRAIDSRTVLSRWRELTVTGAQPDLEAALGVAAATGARYALTGSIVGAGDVVRLVAQVHALEPRATILRTQLEGAPDSLFALVDRLSIEVLAKLLEEQHGVRDVGLARITTAPRPALTAYMEAEALVRRGDYERARVLYQQAVERDSTFALAWFGLSLVEGWIGSIEGADHASRRAIRHAATLRERDALLLRAHHFVGHGNIAALADIRHVTERYPDDALAWYLLGEYLLHNGGALLQDTREAEHAFLRASVLDPDFLPARIHPIHTALRTTLDRKRIDSLVREYERRAPGTQFARELRMGERLAFGDSALRDSLLRTISAGLPGSHLPFFAHEHLSHPALSDAKLAVLATAREQGAGSEAESGAGLLVLTLLARAQPDRALEAIQHPRLNGRGFDLLYLARLGGLPIAPERIVEQLERAELVGYDPPRRLFFSAALALERGDEPAVQRLVDELRERQTAGLAANDSSLAAFIDGALAGIQGYSALRQGRVQEAERLLERARMATAGGGDAHPINEAVRWWLADLAMRENRRERAALLYRSLSLDGAFTTDPFALRRLARLEESMGRGEDALRHYGWLTIAWQHAEPGARPLLEEVRAAVQRLRSAGASPT